MPRVRHIVRLTALVLLGLVITSVPGPAAQTRPSPEKVNGNYVLVFGGYYTGRGNGTVGARSVTIRGNVTDESGATGNFVATCKRDGNHFSGTGSGPGFSVTIRGRLDPSSQGSSQGSGKGSGKGLGKGLRAARLTCTYIAAGGKAGRVAGDLRGGGPM